MSPFCEVRTFSADTNLLPVRSLSCALRSTIYLADTSATRRVLPNTTQYWTHPSISAIGQESDPIHFVTKSARDLVYRAIQSGWQGPPFDPFQLANFAGIKVLPSEDVVERITLSPINSGSTVYNPQPRGLNLFQTFADFPFEFRRRYGKRAIAELSVDYSVPDLRDFVLRVERRTRISTRRVLFARN